MKPFFSWIFKLKYNLTFANIIRTLHFSDLIKFLYYKIYGPNSGKKKLAFNNIVAYFYVNNFAELRALETVFTERGNSEENILEPIMNMLQPGDVAYDIGANIGVHSIFMAIKVGEKGKIVAFEPENNVYSALTQNINLNNLKNVESVKAALGDRMDNGALYRRSRIGIGANSLLKSSNSEFLQRVNIFPGDYIVKERNLPIPKAIKIDVEGFEYPVILGLKDTLSHEICKLVCCEIHSTPFSNNIDPSEIVDILKSLGFTKKKTFYRGTEIHAVFYKY